MRHGDKINNLGRTASHRRAMLANMAIALIEHKRITTTLAKAKALRKYVEPLVTKAKSNTTHSRRVVFSYLQNKEAVTELFGPIADKIGERPGGYMRVIKLGFRRGDGAETAMIEFVDFNETYNPNAGKVRQAKKTRRGGRRSAAAAPAAPAPEVPAAETTEEAVVEAVAAEEVVEQVAETVAETTEEVVTAAEETATEAVEAVEEVVAEATEEVADAAEEVADAAEEAGEEASEEEKKDDDEKA
ncbi:MAG: 50S ribosomal protein L17 [Lewinellaceae bacterium]|nr:50S ribosomal protein L17 [Lewinellaceae bacterium]